MAMEEQTKGKILTNVNAVSAVMAERAASTSSSEVSAPRHAPGMGRAASQPYGPGSAARTKGCAFETRVVGRREAWGGSILPSRAPAGKLQARSSSLFPTGRRRPSAGFA